MVDMDIQHDGTAQRSSTEDDGFLPDVDPTLRKALRENENLRHRWVRNRIAQFAEVASRNHLVIFSQWTFELLMDVLEDVSDPERIEVVLILVEMAYAGKTFESTSSKVSRETLLSHLKGAIEEIGLEMGQEEFEAIDLSTIRNSFILHRLAREAEVNLRDFPIKIL